MWPSPALLGVLPLVFIAVAMSMHNTVFMVQNSYTQPITTGTGPGTTDLAYKISIFVAELEPKNGEEITSKNHFDKITVTNENFEDNYFMAIIYPNCKHEGGTHMDKNLYKLYNPGPVNASAIDDLHAHKEDWCAALQTQYALVYAAMAVAVVLAVGASLISFYGWGTASDTAKQRTSLFMSLALFTAFVLTLVIVVNANGAVKDKMESVQRKAYAFGSIQIQQDPAELGAGGALFATACAVAGALFAYGLVVLLQARGGLNLSSNTRPVWSKASSLTF